jgi:lysophospholipase L1-like esterase
VNLRRRTLSQAVACLLLTPAVPAAPLALLSIGDSMTEEYAFEIPFSAPDSNPTNANARNWIEIFRLWRGAFLNSGSYESTAFAYGDWRIAGHALNFGVPGFTADDWFRVLASDTLPPLPTTEQLADYRTRAALIEKLPSASVAVILIGANDLKSDYSEIFNGTEPANFFTRIVNRIAAIHDFLRTRRANLPIVICTVPDVGITPDVLATYHDPARRASARAKITGFADQVRGMAAARSATVADIHALTLRYEDSDPFRLNGTTLIKAGAPENPPDHLFCKDGFHPSTVTQALIADTILGAIRQATGQTIPAFTGREILQQILGLNPDQPYLDWIAPFALAASGPHDDPDADRLANLTEFALGLDPSSPYPAPLRFGLDAGRFQLIFRPSAAAAPDGYLSVIAETSGSLDTWTEAGVLTEKLPDGSVRASVAATAPAAYLRLRIQAVP